MSWTWEPEVVGTLIDSYLTARKAEAEGPEPDLYRVTMTLKWSGLWLHLDEHEVFLSGTIRPVAEIVEFIHLWLGWSNQLGKEDDVVGQFCAEGFRISVESLSVVLSYSHPAVTGLQGYTERWLNRISSS